MAQTTKKTAPAPVIDLNEPIQAMTDAMSRTQIEAQIMAARRFRRNPDLCITELTALVTRNEDIAASCVYVLPRGNDFIEGESIRFAEMLSQCWGNIHAYGMPVLRGDETVTSVGIAWDMQTNNMQSRGTRRRITTKEGDRYTEDMVVMTENAATSIAVRNAILAVVPEAYYKPAFEAARRKSIGEKTDGPIGPKRTKALKAYNAIGVREERVLAFLKVQKTDDIGHEAIAKLRALYGQIKEGQAKIDDYFPAFVDGAIVPAATGESEQEKSSGSETWEDLLAAIAKDDAEAAASIQEKMTTLAYNDAHRLQRLLEYRGRIGDLLVLLDDLVLDAREVSRDSTLVDDQSKQGTPVDPFEDANKPSSDSKPKAKPESSPTSEPAKDQPKPSSSKRGAKYQKGGSI